jgi:ABC-2 type transport system ATP-binding protein
VIVNRGEAVYDGSTSALRQKVLAKKEIDLKLVRAVENFVAPEGSSIVKQKGSGIKLSVDTHKTGIDRVVGEILRVHEVEDIAIQPAPLEDVIAEIYRRGGL